MLFSLFRSSHGADIASVICAGLPVTIRLLDPPLHEFLPEGDVDEIVEELANATGIQEEEILSRIEKLSEVNPMLGFRGCRWERKFFGDSIRSKFEPGSPFWGQV